MDLIKQYKTQLVIVLLAAAVVGVGIWAYLHVFTLYVVSTTPGQKSSVSYVTPIITIDLNKDLTADGLKVDSPSGLVVSSFVDGRSLKINIFSGLVANKDYVFTVRSVSSTDGKQLKDYAINFSTNSSDSISQADQKIVAARQQSNKPSLVTDPILQYVPYNTNDYLITPFLDSTADGKGAVTLQITIFLTRQDQAAGRDRAIARIKDAASKYIQSLSGVTSTSYTMLYKVQEP